uniref:Uncharacterized protein n=1 Tax=Arion vulgaris TaxID=1028688 RepID=A0A0B6ZYC8_9EUPU
MILAEMALLTTYYCCQVDNLDVQTLLPDSVDWCGKSNRENDSTSPPSRLQHLYSAQ